MIFNYDKNILCRNCDEMIGIYDDDICLCAAYWLEKHPVKLMPKSSKTHCRDICGKFIERECWGKTTGMILYDKTFRER